MTGWTARVEAPFHDEPHFWHSVGRSTDAFWALALAAVLTAVLGAYAAIAFALPVALLVVSARHARRSTAVTRPSFASRTEWRDAERRAVAAALPGSFVRFRRG